MFYIFNLDIKIKGYRKNAVSPRIKLDLLRMKLHFVGRKPVASALGGAKSRILTLKVNKECRT